MGSEFIMAIALENLFARKAKSEQQEIYCNVIME